MANIKLLRSSVIPDKDLSSYRMTVEVIKAEGITNKIFCKQRLRNFQKQAFDDVFVAICTPAQIEDYGEDAPLEGSSYFRTNKIDIIISRNADYLDSVFDDMVWNTQKLVEDIEALNKLENEDIYLLF